jgi:hypothetical protein
MKDGDNILSLKTVIGFTGRCSAAVSTMSWILHFHKNYLLPAKLGIQDLLLVDSITHHVANLSSFPWDRS